MLSNVIQFVLVVVEVVTALLLIGVILIQRTKSQGLGLAFGSGMGESLFGAQMGNIITRITVILAIVFLANTTLLALMQSGRVEKSVTEGVAPAPAVPAAPPAGMPTGTPAEDPVAPIAPVEGTPVSLPEATPAPPVTDVPADAPAADVPPVAVEDVPATPAEEPKPE